MLRLANETCSSARVIRCGGEADLPTDGNVNTDNGPIRCGQRDLCFRRLDLSYSNTRPCLRRHLPESNRIPSSP
jgi:hypothetical protein